MIELYLTFLNISYIKTDIFFIPRKRILCKLMWSLTVKIGINMHIYIFNELSNHMNLLKD